MKQQRFLCSLVVLLFAICLSETALAQTPAQFGSGDIATLYALDPITSHLSLNDGKPGTVVEGSLAYNRDSQLSFNTYERDSFRVGIQGGEVGAIVDLGSDDDLQTRYGYKETVGNVQGFTSIHLEAGSAVILKDYRTKQFQPLREYEELGRDVRGQDVRGSNSAAVVVGHTYLVRITQDRKVSSYVKLKVLAFVPGQYVTIRWARL